MTIEDAPRPQGLRRERRFNLYCTIGQLELWTAAARASGLPTPDFARRALDDAARRALAAAARRAREGGA